MNKIIKTMAVVAAMFFAAPAVAQTNTKTQDTIKSDWDLKTNKRIVRDPAKKDSVAVARYTFANKLAKRIGLETGQEFFIRNCCRDTIVIGRDSNGTQKVVNLQTKYLYFFVEQDDKIFYWGQEKGKSKFIVKHEDGIEETREI